MKSKNTLMIALLTAVLGTGAATAQTQSEVSTQGTMVTDSGKLKVHEIKPMQFRVSFYLPESSHLLVRIIDTDNHVLYAENKRTNNNYLKYFDLSTLADGKYTFEITDGKEKYTQSFDILTKTSRVVSTLN